MTNGSPFAGLGARDTSAPPPPPGDEDDQDDFARASVKRTVSAAGAPSVVPPNAIVSPFSHPYVPGSTVNVDDEPSANPSTTEEIRVPKSEPTTRRPKPTKGTSPRFQICALLMAKGDLTREQLLADVSADRTGFNNAMFNAKAAGHIEHKPKTDAWHITAAGKAWTGGGANLDNHKAAAAVKPKPAAAAKKPRKAAPAAAPAAPAAPSTALASVAASLVAPAATDMRFAVITERSFRCAVFSDGGFHLRKNDQVIDLTPAEHSEMLRYLERMAEQPAA